MKNRLALAVAVGGFSLLTVQAFSAEADNAAYRQGYGLVLEQKWAEAQEYFERFQDDYPDSLWADDAAFWNCYAIEQSTAQESANFSCYENFISAWPESSWASDARSKLLVMGSRLASRGNLQYMQRLGNNWNIDIDPDFDFDFDGNAIADSVAVAMDRAQQELERVRISRNDITFPDLPDIPDIEDLLNSDELRQAFEEIRVQTERAARETALRKRSSVDDELLTVLAALRDNERASEILIDRFDQSSDPELRARIVLLLEDFNGELITNKLMDIVRTDDEEEVRNNAIIVLLDRNDPVSRDFLLEIVTNSSYSVPIRTEILRDMDRWNNAGIIDVLDGILQTETDSRLIAATADTLADIGSETAANILMASFAALPNQELRYRVLSEIADIESAQVLSFLSETALSGTDDEAAAAAIAGIAERENNQSVAALEHIYVNTENPQRKLAAIHGIGKSETRQAVEVLQQFLQDVTDTVVVSALVNALGNTQQETAVPVILGAYRSNSDAEVQRAAIRALRRLDEYPAATEGMLEILEARLNAQSAQ